VFVDAEEREDLTLQRCEFGIEDLDEVAVAGERVALGVAEQGEDLLGGRSLAGPAFGVERDGVEAFAAHGVPQFALDKGLDEQDQEVDGEQSFDASGALEEHRGDLVDGFDLLEALLEGRLAFVGGEDLGGRQGPVVAQQRIHAVGLFVVGDGLWVEGPLEVVAPASDLAVLGVGPGPSATGLLERMVLADGALDLEVVADPVALEDLGDLEVDGGRGALSCPRMAEPALERGQALDRGGEVALPPGLLLEGEEGVAYFSCEE
jgi:hypothetical protein